jgi:putative ABC transport system permease protein
MTTLLHDLRYGWRVLARNPGFTAVAVLTLALGIGATTAIFTVVYAVLLRPLPYPEPDRLVYIAGDAWGIFSRGREFLAWKGRSQTLSQIAAYIQFDANLTGGGEAERVTSGTASPSFFQLLGVQPALGRLFLPEEDRVGASPVAVISHAFWKRRFGGDPSVIGRALTLDARIYTVIGVLPASFLVPDKYGADYDVWVPLSAGCVVFASIAGRTDSSGVPLVVRVIGRLRPGVSYEQARSELDTILQSTLKNGAKRHAVVTLWHEDITGKARLPLLVFLAAVGFVLLIACVNVANLMLSRAATREKEMAVRLAVGAGKARLLRQLLTESVLMALLGGAIGMALASWGKDLLVAFISPNLPTLHPIRLEYRVLGFNLGLAVLTGLAFGFAPALQASKVPLIETLKEAGRSTSEGRAGHHLRSLLVVFEVGLAMVLLIGAGLLFRSFLRLRGMDTGFRSDRILSLSINVTPSKYPKPKDQAGFFEQVMEKVRGLGGVESVGGGDSLPSESSSGPVPGVTIEGRPEAVTIRYRTVSSGYFRTLGIPLLQGRYFNDADREGHPSVAIVNESFARLYFPDGNCLGRRVESLFQEKDWTSIVGVVGDVRPWLESEASPEMYLSYLQAGEPYMELAVRTSGDPKTVAVAVRTQIASVDKDQPPYDLMTLEERRARYLAPRGVNMLLLGAFAGLALVLGSIGVYGVVSYSVSQRTHEIGLRIALGASPQEVLKLVVGQEMLLTIAGVGLGLAGALAMNKVMSSLLFRVTGTDPFTYAGVSVVWILVALLACYLPARRAMKVDPMVALRYE